MIDTYLQADDFARIYGDRLSPEMLELAKAYAGMGGYGKLKRIATLRRYNLWKEGVSRRMGQFLFS